MTAMTREEAAIFEETVAHFEGIARANRFPENADIPHDVFRCAVCHPELIPLDPFAVYLEVAARSIVTRRPALDDTLVAVLNEDLALAGSAARVTREALLESDEDALGVWRTWIFEALQTALDLLSVHSATAHAFSLEEAEENGLGHLIEQKIREIMARQREGGAG